VPFRVPLFSTQAPPSSAHYPMATAAQDAPGVSAAFTLPAQRGGQDRSPMAARPQPCPVVLAVSDQLWPLQGSQTAVTEEAMMRPIDHYQLMQARVTDLHREAARDRLAQAAKSARRPRHSRHPATSHPAARLVRRALAALAARALSNPR
jgi:hypothetical protein